MPIQVTCPECSRALRVPDHLLNQMVKCPACSKAFQASVSEGGAAPPPTPSEPPPLPQEERVSERPSRRERDDDRYRARDDDRGRERDDDRYRERDRDRYDDDRDYDRGRRRFAPHRGGMILAFGLIALLLGIWPLGIAAWIMGAQDLREIRGGRMDPAGESNTNVGYWLGIISTIGWMLGGVCCCGFGFIGGMMDAAGR